MGERGKKEGGEGGWAITSRDIEVLSREEVADILSRRLALHLLKTYTRTDNLLLLLLLLFLFLPPLFLLLLPLFPLRRGSPASQHSPTQR